MDVQPPQLRPGATGLQRSVQLPQPKQAGVGTQRTVQRQQQAVQVGQQCGPLAARQDADAGWLHSAAAAAGLRH